MAKESKLDEELEKRLTENMAPEAFKEESMPDDVKQIKAERDAARAEAADWKRKYHEVKDAHDQLQTAHSEVINKTGYKVPKEYQYKEGECRPVPVNGVCDVCGWDRNTQMRPNDKMKEPHAIA